jgi:hypothetical protein
MATGDMDLILEVMAGFPKTFGLRSFPGDIFRISEDSSYVTGGSVMLYTQRKSEDHWADFAKGSPSEIRAQIVHLK